jgi:hypothetical protein
MSKVMHAECGLPNPSTRPLEQCRTIDIFADALYWKTGERVEWGFTITQSENSQQINYKTFSFDWAPGFRVGLGYNMEHDLWDTQLSYTWFQSKANGHASGLVTGASLAARLSLLEPFAIGKSRINLRYNIFDWDLGRSFSISDYLTFRPYIGLKGGRINQIIHFHWKTGEIFDLFTIAASEKMINRFQGGGPKGGMTGKWCFGNIQTHTFSLIGAFEAAFLWGHWTIKNNYIDSLPTDIKVKTSARNFGALVLHGFIGLGWDLNFNCDQSHFSLHIGYEIEDWFDQFQIYSDISGSQTNDLILQGLNAGLRFDF